MPKNKAYQTQTTCDSNVENTPPNSPSKKIARIAKFHARRRYKKTNAHKPLDAQIFFTPKDYDLAFPPLPSHTLRQYAPSEKTVLTASTPANCRAHATKQKITQKPVFSWDNSPTASLNTLHAKSEHAFKIAYLSLFPMTDVKSLDAPRVTKRPPVSSYQDLTDLDTPADWRICHVDCFD